MAHFPPETEFLTAQWVLPVSSPPIANGFVAIHNGKILAVGSIADLSPSLEIPPPVPGSLLTPGLVNIHLHLEQSYPEIVGKQPEEPFSTWLLAVVKQNRTYGSSEEKLARSRFGCAEMLATGTTCVNDLTSGPEALQALDEAGLRGIVSPEFFHPSLEPIQIEGMIQIYQALKSPYESHPRLLVGISPHAPYNFAPQAWEALANATNPPLIHAHAAESWDETLYVQGKASGIPELHQTILGQTFHPQEQANSPIDYLAKFSLLNAKTILAHTVYTDAADRKMLADAGVTVAHCPRSNLFLLGRTLHFSDWQDSSVIMGLGTDGRVSTENLDLREEARCAMALHHWSAEQALEMMTINGAKALHLESKIGTLEPGKSADCVLWHSEAFTDSPEELLMTPSTQVLKVWTDGQLRWPQAIPNVL